MAACDYVFGNETELAKLLVFGYKVVGPPATGLLRRGGSPVGGKHRRD